MLADYRTDQRMTHSGRAGAHMVVRIDLHTDHRVADWGGAVDTAHFGSMT